MEDVSLSFDTKYDPGWKRTSEFMVDYGGEQILFCRKNKKGYKIDSNLIPR